MSSGGNRISRRTLALWAALLILCAVVAGVSRAAELSRRRAVSEQSRQRLLGVMLYSRMLLNGRGEGQSLENVEAALNAGRPLPRVPSPHVSVTRVVLPGAAVDAKFEGWEVRLTFVRGRLRSYSATPAPVHEGPSVATLNQLARLRGAVMVFGAAGWLIALCALSFARPWRRQVAQVMLACVLVAAVGWAAEPRRDWSVSGLTTPVPVAIAAAALLSVCAILPPVRANASAAPLCQACGYDLTGNVSGVCPECGRPTPRGRIERWRGVAERIEHVGEAQETDESPVPRAEPA